MAANRVTVDQFAPVILVGSPDQLMTWGEFIDQLEDKVATYERECTRILEKAVFGGFPFEDSEWRWYKRSRSAERFMLSQWIGLGWNTAPAPAMSGLQSWLPAVAPNTIEPKIFAEDEDAFRRRVRGLAMRTGLSGNTGWNRP